MLARIRRCLARAVCRDLNSAQKHVGPRVLRSKDRALIEAVSAAAKRADGRRRQRGANCRINSAAPTSASMFSGSSARARSKKPRACAMFSGVGPLFTQALPWKYKSIASGCSERSARRASTSMSWAFRVLASLRYDFVLHIEQVSDGLFEAFGPQVLAGFGVD